MASVLNHPRLRSFLFSPRRLGPHTRRYTTSIKSNNHTLSKSTRIQDGIQKPFYITTPIFYPNAAPHIGHLYSLVAADVLARYNGLRGRDVKFLAGTDEHGMKIQKAAQKYYGEAGRELEFCDLLSLRFKDLASKANISNTCFVRTSGEAHHRAVEDVWQRLYSKGYIYKSQYSGWYSVTDECFYTDAQVGPAPTSSTPTSSSDSPSAKPDSEHQYISLETGAAVEWCSEENYMFRLSSFRPALLSHILSSPTSIHPPQYRSQVLGWFGVDSSGSPLDVATEDLEDISISRPSSRLSWGVQVPNDPSQTVYVWFDALLIYLSGAGYPWFIPEGTLDVQKMRDAGWPANVQVVGKDILRFHSLYLPAILIALNSGPYDPSTSPGSKTTTSTAGDIPLPRMLLTHAHWTSSGKKMSKSIGNVVDPLAEMDKWGVDGVRFYLMRVGGRWRGDVDWSPEQLDKHHKEITAQLGNYFLRIASPRIAARAIPTSDDVYSGLPGDLRRVFLSQNTREDGSVSASEPKSSSKESETLQSTTGGQDPNYELLKMTRELPAKVAKLMEACEAGMALSEIMELLKHANKVVSDIEPWARTTPPELVHTTRMVGLETLRVAGECLIPFIPETSTRLLEALDGGSGLLTLPGIWKELDTVEGGRAFSEKERAELQREEMEAFWRRWNKREIKGVRLF